MAALASSLSILLGTTMGTTLAPFVPVPQCALALGTVTVVPRGRYPGAAVAGGVPGWMLATEPLCIAVAVYNLARRPPASRRRTVLLAVAVAGLASRGVLQPPLAVPLPSMNTMTLTALLGALPLATGLWIAARALLVDSLRRQLEQAGATRAARIGQAGRTLAHQRRGLGCATGTTGRSGAATRRTGGERSGAGGRMIRVLIADDDALVRPVCG
ncbi:hypothetical protein ACIQWN_38155 [Streptomyces vinaceus]|uniref:hypothetical protein n=1 Tax=Streptomyces vinaceus TaxID=1960 RepID=UPI00380A9628